MTLLIRGATPRSVFGLLGANENAATFALAWTLEQSASIRTAIIARALGETIDSSSATIQTQRHAEDGGFTDIELTIGDEAHVIFEAKIGWQVAGAEQLSRYRARFKNDAHRVQAIVSLSSATRQMALRLLPGDVDGIRVDHLSWTDVRAFAAAALAKAASFEERVWLRHLSTHLSEFVAMDRVTDNTVYVVSLNRDWLRDEGTRTFIDVVAEDRCYFHPVGNTWPSEPQNYVAFRYDGVLQSVHHVDDYDIVENLATIDPTWPETVKDHFVYRLGPPMRPPTAMRTGKINRAAHCRCAIDTLLSGAFDTISDARDETDKRRAA